MSLDLYDPLPHLDLQGNEIEMPRPLVVINLKLQSFHIYRLWNNTCELEMRPASPHFPWKLDTDLNSKLCWPNAGLSLTSLCNAWNKLRRPVGDQTVFKFICIPMTLPFTQAMLILALSTKVNQPLCNHWTSWSPVLQQWPEWESYDYNYKSTQLGNSFTVLLARHEYTTKEYLIPTWLYQLLGLKWSWLSISFFLQV